MSFQRQKDYTGPVGKGQRIETANCFDPEKNETYTVSILVDIPKEEQDIFVTIKIPLALIPTVQEKISQLILMFSDLGRIPRGEYLELSNIALKFVPSFLSKTEYMQLKGAGVIFDENIDNLFTE